MNHTHIVIHETLTETATAKGNFNKEIFAAARKRKHKTIEAVDLVHVRVSLLLHVSVVHLFAQDT